MKVLGIYFLFGQALEALDTKLMAFIDLNFHKISKEDLAIIRNKFRADHECSGDDEPTDDAASPMVSSIREDDEESPTVSSKRGDDEESPTASCESGDDEESPNVSCGSGDKEQQGGRVCDSDDSQIETIRETYEILERITAAKSEADDGDAEQQKQDESDDSQTAAVDNALRVIARCLRLAQPNYLHTY